MNIEIAFFPFRLQQSIFKEFFKELYPFFDSNGYMIISFINLNRMTRVNVLRVQ